MEFGRPLAAQVVDLHVQSLDSSRGFVDRSPKLAAIALPSIDPIDLSGSTPHLCFNLVTKLALLVYVLGFHDEFHAAGFPSPVLPVAVLTEMSPLPVSALEPVLIVETHVSERERCKTGLDYTIVSRVLFSERSISIHLLR